MGKSMAMHLFKLPNVELFVYNRTKSKTDDLVAKGATYCETPQLVAGQVDYLFMCLGYPIDVEGIIFHPETGIKDHMKPGAIIIDHTSSSPELA